MAARSRYRINRTCMERTELERFERGPTTVRHLAKRARRSLMAHEAGLSNPAIATRLGTTQGQVSPWTKRGIDRALAAIRERWSDRPRPGAPDTITAEPGCRVMALAGESPPDSGHPISPWSRRELAAAAVQRGIVAPLSAGQVHRVLEKNVAAPAPPRLAERPARRASGRTSRRHPHPVS